MSRPHVYEHANPLFVHAVRQHGNAPTVLDVGCWNGALGRELIQSCGAVVDGIERDAMQAEYALSAGYRRVEVIDLNEPLDYLVPQGYDFILFGDILEHLLQPKDVLATISRRGKPEARILVSLPNIAFITNRLSHLLGKWDYKDYGILDRTHLRFFTKRTMLALLEEAGLRVLRVDGYVGLHRHPWFIREPLRMLGRVWPSLFAIQIVLEAEILPQ